MSYFGKDKSANTAFGELSVASPTPVIQETFQYNISNDSWARHENGGTVTAADGMASISTGAGASQSASILSRVPIKYSTGQGGLWRGTAIFTQGVTGSVQFIGCGDAFNGFLFGWSGAEFGVTRRTSGEPEVRTLTITTRSTTAENVTVTLSGDAASVPVTPVATISETVNEIAAFDYSAIGGGWDAYAKGDEVMFVSRIDSSLAGTYSLSATAAVGTFAQDLAGVSSTDTFVAQADWSHPPSWTLDTTKGNVYQIRYQCFGMISFYIENPDTGSFDIVHQMKYANTETTPSVKNPSLPVCVYAENTTNTTDIVIKTASLAGFIEGINAEIGPSHGMDGNSIAVSTTEIPIVSIRTKTIYQGMLNRALPKITFVNVNSEGAKPITFRFYLNAELVGASWSDVEANTSIAEVDNSATGFVTGHFLFSAKIGKADSATFDLNDLDFKLPPSNTMTVTAEATSGTQEAGVSINYRDLF